MCTVARVGRAYYMGRPLISSLFRRGNCHALRCYSRYKHQLVADQKEGISGLRRQERQRHTYEKERLNKQKNALNQETKVSPMHCNMFLSTESLLPPLREEVKYYFANFVRKGSNPPSPLWTIFWKERSYGFGGYPPPPLYGFPPKKIS